MIIGEIEEARPYTDRDGNNRASLEVTAQTIKFLRTNADGKTQTVPVGGSVESEVPF